MSVRRSAGSFAAGECVVYKNNGICRVTDLQKRKFAGEERDYYVLDSIFDPHSTWYVPVDSPELTSSMSRILSPDEIDLAIAQSLLLGEIWTDGFKERSELYSDVLKSGDRARMIALYRTLCARRDEAEKNRRKLYVSDERALRTAEKMISEEFSYALGIQRSEVAQYIAGKVGEAV